MHPDGRRCHSGVFVGIDRRTGQYMIYSDDKVRLARTVVRVPEADKWIKESLAGVRCTPWDLHAPRETEIIFTEKIVKGHGVFEEKVILARQPYIRASDLEEHGMTRGCPKCDHTVKYQTWGAAHTPTPADRGLPPSWPKLRRAGREYQQHPSDWLKLLKNVGRDSGLRCSRGRSPR